MSRSRRRMIFPERVFGRSAAKMMSSGFAIAPILCATCFFKSSASPSDADTPSLTVTNDRLRRALEMKLFEDQKDSIKLSSFVSNVIDKETQDKIDIIKGRLIKNYGYNEASATDVLAFVASIFARGDVKD